MPAPLDGDSEAWAEADVANVTFRNIGNFKLAIAVFRFAPRLAPKPMAAYG